MKRFLFLVAAGLISAQAAGFQLPRYRLAPGMKIWCSSITDARDWRGTSHNIRQREHWVLGDSAGAYKVLMRVTEQGYRTDTAGKRTDDPTVTGWELFEMTPEGHLLRDQSTMNIDVAASFPLLPPDSAAAANGWTEIDTSNPLPSTYSFRLDDHSMFDSLWAVDRVATTPLDTVYDMSPEKERVVIHTRRGLPLRCDVGFSDTVSRRAAQSSITLDSVTKFDAANLDPQLRDMVGYFDLATASDSIAAKADPADTTGVAERLALDLLQTALQQTHDSTVIELLMQDMAQQQQSSAYALSETKTRLHWRGKPAPAWTLADLDGRKHSLKEYRGRVLVLDWWYKDCPWCMMAMPQLTEVARRYTGRPVTILGMNVDKDTADARSAIAKLKPAYASLLAGRVNAKKYGVTGYPTLFIVDKKGRVADVEFGYSRNLAATLSAKLDALLGR